ncbi:MAG: hypothetical protein GY864_02890 [Desulfobacterales bacterium]|nr:hypothetical protein [Desulfobacterales bacterium]
MTTAVRVSENLVREARLLSAVDNRSVTGQIEHWARIGKCAEENPDLTYRLTKDILDRIRMPKTFSASTISDSQSEIF